MPKRPIALCLTACLLCACGASPQLPLPSGWKRVPVNSPAAIEEYNATAAREAAGAKEDAQRRQEAALTSELAQLKALMAEQAPDGSPAGARTSVPARAKAVRAGAPAMTAKGTGLRPSEAVITREHSILFRVALGRGETRFAPSLAFRQALLDAARKAERVDVRGVGDAPNDRTSIGIARMRAEAVRTFLLANGIDSARISRPEPGTGTFNAGGAAFDARVRNHGVDIAVISRDTAVSVASQPTTHGALQ